MPVLAPLCLLLCLLPVLVQAAPVSAGHQALAGEFVELTRADRLSLPAYQQVQQMFAARFAEAGGQPSQRALLERYQSQADALLQKVAGRKVLEPALQALYSDAFSEAELRELLAFYRTPVGRKLLDQLPQLMALSAELTQQRLRQAVPEVERLLAAMTDELKTTTGARR